MKISLKVESENGIGRFSVAASITAGAPGRGKAATYDSFDRQNEA